MSNEAFAQSSSKPPNPGGDGIAIFIGAQQAHLGQVLGGSTNGGTRGNHIAEQIIAGQEAQLGENKAISGNDNPENIGGGDLQLAGHEAHVAINNIDPQNPASLLEGQAGHEAQLGKILTGTDGSNTWAAQLGQTLGGVTTTIHHILKGGTTTSLGISAATLGR